MKSSALTAVLVLVLCAPACSADFTGKKAMLPLPLEMPSQDIPVGEKLVYEVSWIGVPVGYGELEVKEKTERDGRPVYPLVAVARTNDFLSKIYPVRDEVHSYVNAGTLFSDGYEKKVSEGRYRAEEDTRFDARNKIGHYRSLLNGSSKEFEIGGQVHDILSAFFWFRRQNVPPGMSVHAVVNSEEKDYDLDVQVLARENKELRDHGVYDTLLVEPKTRLKGILYKRGRVWVYFTAGKHRVPIWVVLRTPFGPVTGVLKREKSVFPYEFD